MTHTGLTAMTWAVILAGTGAVAQDQNISAELDALKARIATLEAQQTAVEQKRPVFGGFEILGPAEDTSDSKNYEFLNVGNLRFNLTPSTEITLYGFARAEAFYDFDFQQGDLTRTGRIGEPGFATDGAFDTSVRVSRFGIRSATQTGLGEVGTQLEFDLFGSGGDDTGSPNLRLRHANVTIGDHWLIGQFWANFMPLVHYPRTADFNGPVGITFARQPQVRYSNSVGAFDYSVSVEEFNGASDDPVLTAAGLYSGSNWSVRGAVMTGRADSDIGTGTVDMSALTLSGNIKPWQGGSISATYSTGEGFGSYLIGGGANAVGGVANDVDGFTLEVRQQVTPKVNIGIAYGNEDYDLPTSTGTIDFTEVETVFVNAFYQPTDGLTFALEYSHGERTTSSGVSFDADRIGASVTMSF